MFREHVKMKKIIFLLTLFIFIVNIAYADVGVGLSPSRVVLEVEGGKTQQIDLLVFNSGDYLMEVGLSSEGDIADFTEIEPTSIIIEPEPKPQALPIKNGKTFIVKFKPPATRESKTYTGTISATGKPTGGSSFGGSVGVATKVELIVTPTVSMFAFITTTHILVAGIIILLIIIILLFRKAGFRFKIEKK